MPDFSDQMNISDTYRLSPSTGVPKTKSKPPPIGGTRLQPGGGGDLGVVGPDPGPRPFASYPGEADAHVSHAAEQRLPGTIGEQPPLSTPGKFPPRAPSLPVPSASVHGPGDDLVGAYGKLAADSARPRHLSLLPQPSTPTTAIHASGDDLMGAYGKLVSGFPADAGIGPYVPPPSIAGSAGQAETFMPAMQEAAGHATANAAAQATPFSRGLAAVGNAEVPRLPEINWRGMAGAGAMALPLAGAADPRGFTDAATHPIGLAQQLGRLLSDPQGTWAPAFGEGWQRLADNNVGGMELGSAAGQALGMQAALNGGMNMGQNIHRNISNFGQGNMARELGAGMRVIGNKISDAWHDPGGNFPSIPGGTLPIRR